MKESRTQRLEELGWQVHKFRSWRSRKLRRKATVTFFVGDGGGKASMVAVDVLGTLVGPVRALS